MTGCRSYRRRKQHTISAESLDRIMRLSPVGYQALTGSQGACAPVLLYLPVKGSKELRATVTGFDLSRQVISVNDDIPSWIEKPNQPSLYGPPFLHHNMWGMSLTRGPNLRNHSYCPPGLLSICRYSKMKSETILRPAPLVSQGGAHC